MIRKISKLKNSQRTTYFSWRTIKDSNEDGNYEEFESFSYTMFNLQEDLISKFPEFKKTEDWVTDKDVIVLRGYGVEIGMASNGDVGSLSIRVDDDDIYDAELVKREQWIESNWEKICQNYDDLRLVGMTADGKLNLSKVVNERVYN